MRQFKARRAFTAAIALCSVQLSMGAHASGHAGPGVEFGQPAPALTGSSVPSERFEVLFGNRAEQLAALTAARAALAAKDTELTAQKTETERQARELTAERERLHASAASESATRAQLEQQVERLAKNYEQAKAQLEVGQGERTRLAEQVATAEQRIAVETSAAEGARAEAAAAKAEIAAMQAEHTKLTKFEITPEDKTVRAVIERWAVGAGYQVAWNVGGANWDIEFGGSFGDNFLTAVDSLVVGVNQYLAQANGRAQSAQLLAAKVHSNGIVRIYFTQPSN